MNDFVKFGLIILAVMFIMKLLNGDVEGFEEGVDAVKAEQIAEQVSQQAAEQALESANELIEEQAAEEVANVQPSDEATDIGAEVPVTEGNVPSQLTAKDLLPTNDEADIWAETNPDGEGIISDKNFLNAGYHIGVDTVGQSLRNANYGLRSEPPNPREVVSPWMNTTIDSDRNRRPLEIGGSD
jgi:hypothetical protein